MERKSSRAGRERGKADERINAKQTDGDRKSGQEERTRMEENEKRGGMED